jgi:uncharacterized membrane protein (TIGR02234 family)
VSTPSTPPQPDRADAAAEPAPRSTPRAPDDPAPGAGPAPHRAPVVDPAPDPGPATSAREDRRHAAAADEAAAAAGVADGAAGHGGSGAGARSAAGGEGRGGAGRELAAVAGVCAVGGGMVLFAVGRPWVEITARRASPLPDVTVALSGRDLAPLVAGLGIVGLAGVVGLLATRRWGRLVVAAIVALAGVGVLAGSLTRLAAPGPGAARDLLAESGRAAGASAITAIAHPGWPLLAAVGGLLLALGGLAALVRSRRWPTMSARYETPAARTRRPRTDAAVWDALDRGDDPTVTP